MDPICWLLHRILGLFLVAVVSFLSLALVELALCRVRCVCRLKLQSAHSILLWAVLRCIEDELLDIHRWRKIERESEGERAVCDSICLPHIAKCSNQFLSLPRFALLCFSANMNGCHQFASRHTTCVWSVSDWIYEQKCQHLSQKLLQFINDVWMWRSSDDDFRLYRTRFVGFGNGMKKKPRIE